MSPPYSGLVNTKMMTPIYFPFTSHLEDFEPRASHLPRFFRWLLPCQSPHLLAPNGEPTCAFPLHDMRACQSPCMHAMLPTRLLRLSTWHEPRDQWQGLQLLQSRTKLTVHARGTGMIFISIHGFLFYSLIACFHHSRRSMLARL